MASPMPKSIFFLAHLLLLIPAHGRVILVGGSTTSWKVPSSSSESLNRWAESTRFQIGDSLVWSYDGQKDSVMEVSKEDYYTCGTSNPIAVHHGGHNKVSLVRSGAYYFIGGAAGSCAKGERVIVVVMSEKHGRSSGFPAPAPMEIDEGPAAAPAIAGDASRAIVGGGVAAAALGFVGMMIL